MIIAGHHVEERPKKFGIKPPHTLTPVRVLTVSGAAGAKAIC
jgi:hypothetical protein